jgi:hypothetical protein
MDKVETKKETKNTKEYFKQYYKDHKEDILKKQSEKVECKYCGASVRKQYKVLHERSNKCLKSQNSKDDTQIDELISAIKELINKDK